MKTILTALVCAGVAMAAMPVVADGAAAKDHKDAAKVSKVKKAQTTCPVMGGRINRKLYVDADGKRIYVCCQDCLAPVRKDPAKYIKILEDQGVTLEKAPVKKKK